MKLLMKAVESKQKQAKRYGIAAFDAFDAFFLGRKKHRNDDIDISNDLMI